MRNLLILLGHLLSIVYPYKLHLKIKGGIKILYTSWITYDFMECGKNVKFGFGVHIAGAKHIALSDDILYDDGGAITAFAVNNITPPHSNE